MQIDEVQTSIGSCFNCGIYIVGCHDGRAVSTVKHEEHLTIAHAGFQVNDLADAEVQQLFAGHLPQRRPLLLNDTDLVVGCAESVHNGGNANISMAVLAIRNRAYVSVRSHCYACESEE